MFLCFCFNRGFELSMTFLSSITPDNQEMPVYTYKYMHTRTCARRHTHTQSSINRWSEGKHKQFKFMLLDGSRAFHINDFTVNSS
jgi:hypothetical protein